MAAVVTLTYSKSRTVKTVVWTVTSHTDGSAGGAAAAISGEILRVATNPGATAPTDDWDFTITDEDGLDVCMGKGANRDTTNSEHFCPLIGDGTTTDRRVAVDGILTLNVTNAGSTKDLVVTLYYR